MPGPPVAVREDDDEKKVAPKLDSSISETPVIQRQKEEDEELEEIHRKPTLVQQIQRHAETAAVASGIIYRLCKECAEEKEEPAGEMVHRKAKTGSLPGNEGEPSLAANINDLNNGGSPLPETTRAFFEPRFGADFSNVRVHDGLNALNTARLINAKAFTFGQNIAFGAGQYDPHSQDGRRLLAHELTHVIQQNGPAVQRQVFRNPDLPDSSQLRISRHQSTMLQRDPDRPETATRASTPGPATMTVSMSGLSFKPAAGATYTPGRKLSQGVAMILMRLIPEHYQPGLENELVNHLRQNVAGFGIAGLDGNAVEGEPLTPIIVDIWISLRIVGWARSRHYQVALSNSQLELLDLGLFASDAWSRLQNVATQNEIGVFLPAWYSQFIFKQELGRRAALLRAYVEASITYEADKSAENRQALINELNEIVDVLLPGINVVEKIKHETDLREHEGYIALFGGVAAPPTATPPATPATGQAAASTGPTSGAMEKFLTYLHSQPDLMSRIESSSYTTADARVLLDRFARYLKRAGVASGDQMLRDQPGGANEVPHPATLTSFPALEPPLFDAALGTSHHFTMTLLFPNVFDAFANHYFEWERVRVPDSAIGGKVDLDTLQGEEPSFGEVAGAEFARAGRYLEADMKRSIGNMVSTLNVQPGVSAPTLSLANGILRFLGTGIRLGFEYLTMPRNEKKIVFPGQGLYLVRCKAIPQHGEDAEVVRAPSVAFIPVFARHPQEMAQIRVQSEVNREQRSIERVLELQALLSEPVSHLNQQALEDEYAALTATLGSAEDMLVYQQKELTKRLAMPDVGPERPLLEKRLEELQVILGHRRERAAERPLERAQRLAATFVSDTGQIMHLVIEAVELAQRGRLHEVYISDVTTRKSGQGTATGSTKSEAIQAALTQLLKGNSGYGRGYCSVSIDGTIVNLRIDASEGMMVMEAIENLTTVASIAAVAAAPFTGGASLSLLLPIGLVGAIPSAYRIASRAEAGTLHLDLELAMDIVNIAGGLAGGAQAVTKSLRVGSALMVIGMGSDGLGVLLMGAGIMEQIAALEGMPAGMRAARIMEIMGNAMLNAGIMIGGALAARRHQFEAEIAASDPLTREWVSVRSNERIVIGGEPHQVSVGIVEGRLVIRICSDCQALLRKLRNTLQDPAINGIPGLRSKLEEISTRLTDLDQAITSRSIEPADAQLMIEDITIRLKELAASHPQPLSSLVGKETPQQHERRNILEDMQRRGEATPHSFTLTEGIKRGDPQNRFSRIARELKAHIDQIVASGMRNPVPDFNEGVLKEKSLDIVMSDSHLRALYTEIYQAVVQGHKPTLALPQYRHLTRQTKRRMRKALEKFDSKVRDTRPDIVDFDLLRGRIDVSDITFDYANPVHNLKTLYYAEVMRRMTGLEVTATEVASRVGGMPVFTPL